MLNQNEETKETSLNKTKIEAANFLVQSEYGSSASKSSKHKKDKVMLKWSILTFLANLWSIFSVVLWPSILSYPTGIFYMIDCLTEIWLLIDIFFRIGLKLFSPKVNKRIELLHADPEDSYYLLVFVLFTSIPQYLMYGGILDDGNNLTPTVKKVYFTLLIKLLRSFELKRAFAKTEKLLYHAPVDYILTFKLSILFIYLLIATHLSTCSWLLAQFSIQTEERYYERTNTTSAPLIQKYVDGASWAVSAMNGDRSGDVTPKTNKEGILSVLVMTIGVGIFAKIFSDFEYIIHLLSIERRDTIKKFQTYKNLIKMKHIDNAILLKIENYSEYLEKCVDDVNFKEYIADLPESLKSEVSLSVNKDMIPLCNIFNTGDPVFLSDILLHCYAYPVLKEDIIINRGDHSEAVYFIKSGEFEILAPDEKMVVAVLSKGAYFGEVGVIFDIRRTLTVRAKTDGILNKIDRESFIAILSKYKEQEKIFTKIAKQRLSTSTFDDFGLRENAGSSQKFSYFDVTERSDVTDNAKQERPAARKNTFKASLNRLVSLRGLKKEFKGFVILSFSKVFYAWSILLISCVLFQIFYVPVALCFSYTPKSTILVLDVLCLIVFFFDIVVNATTVEKENEKFMTDISLKLEFYIKNRLSIDVLSLLPFDYILLSVLNFQLGAGLIRLTRLLKVPRAYKLFNMLKGSPQFKLSQEIIMLLFLVVIFIILNHYVACIMYALSYWEHDRSHENFFHLYDEKTLTDVPLTAQGIFVKYVTFLYWAYAASTGGSYGDLVGLTVLEKAYEIFAMLLFRIYLSFVAAQLTSIIHEKISDKWDYFDKIQVLEEWSIHNNLPSTFSKRIKLYYENLWDQCEGLNEDEVVMEVPPNIRSDLIFSKYEQLMKSVPVFPKNDRPLLNEILVKIKNDYIPKNEYLARAGELCEELYIILEGTALLVNQEKSVTIEPYYVIESFDYEKMIPIKQQYTIKTESNVSIAILHLKDLKILNEKYPKFQQKLLKFLSKQSITQKIVRKNTIMISAANTPMNSHRSPRGFLQSYTKIIETTEERLKKKFSFKNFLTGIFLIHQSEKAIVIIFCVYLVNYIIIPLNLAFPDSFSYSDLYPLEIFTILILTTNFLYNLRIHYRSHKESLKIFNSNIRSNPVKKKSVPKLFDPKIVAYNIIELFCLIPFPMIFEFTIGTNRSKSIFLTSLQIVRLLRYDKLFSIFSLTTKRMALTLFIQCIYVFFLFNHLFGTLFLVLGQRKDPEHTWFSKLPAPVDEWPEIHEPYHLPGKASLYLSSLYWAYVTTGHIGIGDISPVDNDERLYTIAVFFFGIFLTIAMFAMIVAIAEKMRPRLKREFENNYRMAMEFAKNYQLTDFIEILEKLFNYIWERNRGIDENNIFEELPVELKADINFTRYSEIIYTSAMINGLDTYYIKVLFRSFFKWSHVEIYTADDLVIDAGQVPNKLFFLIDGEAESISFDKEKTLKIETGRMIGCIQRDEMYYATVKAKKTCRFATITEEQYEFLKKSYPEWTKNLEQEEELMKKSMLEDLVYFRLLKAEEETKNGYKVDDDLIMFYANNSKLNAKKILSIFAKNQESPFQRIVKKLIKEIRSYKDKNPLATLDELAKWFHKDKEKSRSPSKFLTSTNVEKKTRSLIEQNLAIYINQLARKKNSKLNSKYYFFSNSKAKIYVTLVHSIFVLYSCIQLPIWVAYLDIDTTFWIVLDLFAILESIFFIICQLRTAIYMQGALTVELKHTFSAYFENGFLIDALGAIPFNLFFVYTTIDSRITAAFRLLRILQAFNLKRDFANLEGFFRHYHHFFKGFKSILLLVIIWHWTACLWFFIDKELYEDPENTVRNWYRETGSDTADVIIKWMYSLEFVMSIATTTGYSEQRIYSDVERIIFLFIVYIGIAMFSLGFGLMSEASEMFSEFFEKNYLKLRKLQRMEEKGTISSKVLEKIRDFNAFRIIKNYRGNEEFEELRDIIPPSLIEDLIFDRVKEHLLKLPILGKTDQFLREMASSLEIKAYLPMDFLYHKNEIAGEIIFILEGTVGLIEEDGTISGILEAEENTGEEMIFKRTKRPCSAIALEPCIVAVFYQFVYEELIKFYPIVLKAIEKEMMLGSGRKKTTGRESVRNPMKISKGTGNASSRNLLSSQRSLRKLPAPMLKVGTFNLRKSLKLSTNEEQPVSLVRSSAKRGTAPPRSYNSIPEHRESAFKIQAKQTQAEKTYVEISAVSMKKSKVQKYPSGSGSQNLSIPEIDQNNGHNKTKSENFSILEDSERSLDKSENLLLNKKYPDYEDAIKVPSPREAVIIAPNEPTEVYVNKTFQKKLTIDSFTEKIHGVASPNIQSPKPFSPTNEPEKMNLLGNPDFDSYDPTPNNNYLKASTVNINMQNFSELVAMKKPFNDFEEDDADAVVFPGSQSQLVNQSINFNPSHLTQSKSPTPEPLIIKREIVPIPELQDSVRTPLETKSILKKKKLIPLSKSVSVELPDENLAFGLDKKNGSKESIDFPLPPTENAEIYDPAFDNGDVNNNRDEYFRASAELIRESLEKKNSKELMKSSIGSGSKDLMKASTDSMKFQMEVKKKSVLLYKKDTYLPENEVRTIGEILEDYDPEEVMKENSHGFNPAEVVEENELATKKEKPSKRYAPKFPGERRYSRISMVKELGLTKDPCVHLRWGMNLD